MTDWFEWREAPRCNYGVIGDPISHSLSPVLHQAAYEASGLPYCYSAIRVPEPEFVEALDHLIALGYLGVNVTLPLKHRAACWARSTGAEAARSGSANTLDLSARVGTSTDGSGFLESLAALDLKGTKALVLGTGGSAAIVACALLDSGWAVALWGRNAEAAFALANHIGAESSLEPDPSSCSLIVNATSAGLSNLCPEVLWRLAEPDAIAFDLSYSTEPTPFCTAAANQLLQCLDGREMLLAQAALSFEWWINQPAPRLAMRKALYEAIKTNL